jgi:hypothetical protein
MPSSKPAPFSFIDINELREQLNFMIDDIYSKLDFALSLDGKGVMTTLKYGGLGQDVSGFNGLIYLTGGASGQLALGTGLVFDSATGKLHLNVTAKGDILAGTGTQAMAKLPIGTAGQVLSVGGAHATGLEWASTVLNTLLHANSILKADVDHTPVELAVGTEALVGRTAPVAGGVITGLTAAQVLTFLGVPTQVDTVTLKADHVSEHTAGHHVVVDHPLVLPAGAIAAGKGPLKFTLAGTALLTTPEAGALEPFSDDLYYTITTGAARKGVVLTDGFPLTDTRIPFATTNGRMTDAAGLTFDVATNVLNLALGGTNAQPGLVITGYNDQETYEPYLYLRKSHHDTFGTVAETQPGEELGGIYFYGVNSTPFFAQGFHILVVQDGASGAGLVPTAAYLETCTTAGVNTNQLVLSSDGRVGINQPTPAYQLDIVGNLRCSTGFGCNGKNPQTAYGCAAWDEPGAGAYGVDSAAHMAALVELVQNMQSALVANGIMAIV